MIRRPIILTVCLLIAILPSPAVSEDGHHHPHAMETGHFHGNGQATSTDEETFEIDLLAGILAGPYWSDPASWPERQVPTATLDVLLDRDMVIDGGTCRTLTIVSGTVTLAGALHVHGSIIVEAGAKLQGSTGEIYFYVSDDQQNLGAHGHMPDPVDIGLWIMPDGNVDFRGIPKTPWLNAVGSGSVESRRHGIVARQAISGGLVQLAAHPIGWMVGDTLLLTNEYGNSAVTKLLAIDGPNLLLEDSNFAGSTLHFRDREVGSPKVANLSRSLKIISALCVPGDTNHRAHTLALAGSSLTYKHVEFRNLGPRGIQGEYPVHVHHGGNSTPAHIEGCSIWQDCGEPGNRWATIHDSSGVRLLNNVGYLSRGHGFFMESGTERDCVIVGNLGVEATGKEEIPVHSPAASRIKFAHCFWIWSGNIFGENVSVGQIHGWRTVSMRTVGFVIKNQAGLTTHVHGHEHYGGHSGGWTEGPSTMSAIMVHAAGTGIFPSKPNEFQRLSDSFIACDTGLSGYAYPGHIVTRTTILSDVIVSTQGQTLAHLSESECAGDFLVTPEVWRIGIAFERCSLIAHLGVTTGAKFAREQMYSLIRVANCDALIAGEVISDADFCSDRDHIHAHGFEGRPIGEGDGWLLNQPAPPAGYIRCIPNWKGYWSVTPLGQPDRPRTLVKRDILVSLPIGVAKSLKGYSGGLPPGRYRVKVWRDNSDQAPIVVQIVNVVAGQMLQIRTGL